MPLDIRFKVIILKTQHLKKTLKKVRIWYA